MKIQIHYRNGCYTWSPSRDGQKVPDSTIQMWNAVRNAYNCMQNQLSDLHDSRSDKRQAEVHLSKNVFTLTVNGFCLAQNGKLCQDSDEPVSFHTLNKLKAFALHHNLTYDLNINNDS